MNRLILVGNGFDLAHKLETSYCHFISDYLSRAINTFYKNNIYEDPLLSIKWKYSYYIFTVLPPLVEVSKALEMFENTKSNPNFVVDIKSGFLADTIDRIKHVNWVDLENDYFDQLLKCKSSKGFNFDYVKELNEEFNFFKIELEKYLIRHEEENSKAFADVYTELFCQPIIGEDIVTVNMADEMPKRMLFISFNYTKTLDKYMKECDKVVKTELNYIHGELASQSNPIIFGFGDEYNKSYLEFEELRNKELLKHIKSFGYFKTSNYHNLVRFLEIDDFQVYTLGHSLGLSDRTMLKQIFEHDKCKSIKIFYHQKNEFVDDYTDKTYDISSHFSDKGSMRKKIVPWNKSSAMPQPKLLT